MSKPKPDRTRIALTVDKAMVEQFRADLEILQLHPAIMSNLVNEWLTNFSPILRRMAEKKERGEQMGFDEVIESMAEFMGKGYKP